MSVQINQAKKQKRKILCFHGFATNSKVFQYQLRQLIKEFPEIEFESLNGPITLSTNKVDNRLIKMGLVQEEDPVFAWFDSRYSVADQIQQTSQFIEQYLQNNGPYYGILGFSQGSFMASLVCSLIENEKIKIPYKVECYLFVSGQPWWSVFGQEYDKQLYSVKSLHIIGINDFLLDLSLILVSQYVNPFLIYHNQGHKMPTLTYEQIKQLRKFFQDEKVDWIRVNNLSKL